MNPDDWNQKTGRVKSSPTNAVRINSFISNNEAEADAIYLEMETKSRFISIYDI
uniref:Arm DNA-binding domain-containing protein n=1 Tax=Arachidicoccus rhizosphaerae TaxID=551991 RepID=UPI000B8512FB